jgi:hypothetical protein
MADELQWGQTWWDDWPREKLLREVQRMYAALESAKAALRLASGGDERSPFWRRPSFPPYDHGGTGGAALGKCEKVLADYPEASSASENAYRCFFRYAADLFFGREYGAGWAVCDQCGMMLGADGDGKVMDGQTCYDCARNGRQSVMRALEWRDLEPKEADHA